MCRLCALTDTTLPVEFRVPWMDRMLLISQAEDSQDHAWGITNGCEVYKNTGPYTAAPPLWMTDSVFEEKMLLGHVRKASASTGRTCDEAHPYVYDVHGEKLITAHNGWFGGTGPHISGNPDTDSWRAFQNLATLLERDKGDLSPDVFEEWINLYTTATQCGILIYWREKVYAFRHIRPLYVMLTGQGYLINTSGDVLKAMKAYAEKINSVETGEITQLPEHNLVIFTQNRQKVIVRPIEVKLKTAPWVQQRTYDYEYAYRATEDTNTAIVPVAPAAATKPAYATAVTTRPEHSQILKTAAAAANPMRLNMFMYWMCQSLHIPWAGSTHETLKHVVSTDITTFLEMRAAWDERQRSLLDCWNKFVLRENDETLLLILCPNQDWFWLNPEYTSLLARDGVNKLRQDITKAKEQANIV